MRNSIARLNIGPLLSVVALAGMMMAHPAFATDRAHARVIQLQGTSNTRDIGGYQTSDLRTVRRGQIIRSDNLSRLTASDFQTLEEIGIKTVIDLRTDREREQSPTVWLGDHPPQIFHFPIGDAHNDWFNAQRRMMRNNRFTEKQALKHMEDGYRMIAAEGPPSYEKLMELVLDQSNWPILIHCNAGKDRSGVAIALLLEALGVDRDTIMEEFLLTNKVSRVKDKAAYLAKESNTHKGGIRSGRAPSAEAWLPIVGVRAEMLEAFYASVEQQYGSMDAFLTELGVDKEARTTLAASLTTEQPALAMGE
jgi:protein-tyrosine phosphatase